MSFAIEVIYSEKDINSVIVIAQDFQLLNIV